MFNSIHQFESDGIKKLRKAEDRFIAKKDLAGLEAAVKDIVLNLGLNIIGETLEMYDKAIKNSPKRMTKWNVIRTDRKELITSFGTICYEKTFYINRESGERAYLLDKELGFTKHQRMTDSAEAQLLEEAVKTSYKKGGVAVSLLDDVSKETVMDKIHHLDFTKVHKAPESLKEVSYLYIDADEDHVALQFHEHKGDIKRDEFKRKDNCVLAKMIYVYEGIEPVAPKSSRHRLINPHYFCGVYDGKDNEKLWQEVYDYLEETYDLSKVKKVYLNSDGGNWIKGAKKRLHGLTPVLDEFHLNKYLTKMTGGLMDSAGDARAELIHEIKSGTAETFGHVTEHILSVTESNSAITRIADSANYVLHNWSAAKTRIKRGLHLVGCSAEGHVSHVLSDRMSSRPLGWCRKGADKMAHLRAYYCNKGDMLELVRAQKLPMAAGAENDIIADPQKLGESIYSGWGKYVDHANHTVSILGQKYAWLSAQISHI